MRSVSIIGAGQTRFGELWDKSLRDLAVEAAVKAVEDAGLDGAELEAVYGGCMAPGLFAGQEHVGALLADQLGVNPVPSTRVEAACASGSVAFRNAYLAIASGMHDIVAVGGVEKMTEVTTEDAAIALGGAGDQEWELFVGATFPALYALMARRHMHDFGTTEEQMAMCSVKNHGNAVHNAFAQFQRPISVEDVMNSGYIASPLKLLDCSPITDGAAAVILCATEKAKQFTDLPIDIKASSQASDTLALAQRKSLTEINATREAAKKAFAQARLQPKDIQAAEVHDCFSIAEIMAIEDVGFFKKGEGGKATEEGETQLNSRISINTSGGLKACGHPVGATGVKQIVEGVTQLRNAAGKRQVSGLTHFLTHNVGGSGATVTVHILERG